jgi:hypothetical protein
MTSPAAIKYEPFREILLFGGTPLMGRLAERLRTTYAVTMYTAPRQSGDVPTIEGVGRIVTGDINDVLEPYEVGTALGIGLGQAWTYSPELVAAFGPRLVDFMSIPYPTYLGGAHLSHAIMRGERFWGCSMQFVTENTVQGEVHDGALIYHQPMYFPPDDHPNPHADLEDKYLEFVCEFVRLANAGHEFKPFTTHSSERLFFPRLNTERQGWVDWSWRRIDVVRFIRAFDTPYPGARTMIDDSTAARVVTVHDPIIWSADGAGHPFQAGIITDLSRENGVTRAVVSLRGGPIRLTVRDDLGHDPTWLRPGMRLHTDRVTLDRAMTYTPSYTPLGDARERVAL